ncbi:glutathione S-transferase family protein [Devosia rhizoryzae]|uniref:Glutathione S-transferase family protein n=1 Tax=Devosia rhizoryzae TaxID=2774137 RepID=A0ABX7C9W5_9HYPH|nr:glutathione S-transferase family protein [Devosia rhizoryzae]QQR41075.1 glutathione S-transferase family protein [Devosia rhizoryzae]
MTPKITAFKWSPDGGKGMARDTRVRWALEEVGQNYEVDLVSFKQMKQAEHRVRHPFGQIPTYEEDGLTLFESGSIILHIAERHPGLLPTNPDARARAITWMFAALSTVEPPIVEREQADFTDPGQPWHSPAHFGFLEDRIRVRLKELADYLGNRDWLESEFTAGDLMMVMVLRRADTWLLAEFPTLAAYVARAEARPAYQRAYAAQAELYSGEPTDTFD